MSNKKALFVYWQRHAGNSAWNVTTQENLATVLAEEKPEFATVLALDTNIDTLESPTYDDLTKIKYKGPLYADFDASFKDETVEDVQEDVDAKFRDGLARVLDEVRQFMKNLEDNGVRLDECQFSLTGGRGVHILVPEGIFIEKPNPTGYTLMPHIYREMAFTMAVDTLDMRVYSAKRGRMWRTFGVKRSNGNYKVQVPASVMRTLDVDTYLELVRHPTPNFELPAPTYSPKMGALYALKRDEVENRVAARKKAKGSEEVIAKYGGEIPFTIEKIMKGEGLDENAGFHQIAMQLAIFAAAMEIPEDVFLERCQGLCEKHQSDGSRYRTVAQRREELGRLHRYMWGNPCHSYSVGGIVSLLREGTQTADLDVTGLPPPESDEQDIDRSALHMGFAIRQSGIWKAIKNTNGDLEHVLVCSTGLSNISELIDNETLETKGFEVTTHLQGAVQIGRIIMNNDFLTRQGLSKALGSQGFLNIPDSQVGALQEVLKAMAVKSNNRVMTLDLEGVNVMVRREPQVINEQTGERTRYCVRWADAKRVRGFLHPGEVDQKFKMQGPYDPDGKMKSDLADAPFLKGSEEELAWFQQLFEWYDPAVIGRVLGWYSAAFLTQHLRRAFSQFPLLQSYGEAGSGKTSFNKLCLHMHFFERPPLTFSAVSLTKFAMEAAVAGSGSIPVIFDEFKPREMQPSAVHGLMGLLRTNFDGTVGGKGKISQDSGNSKLIVVETNNTAPTGIVTEALVSQEAILHRSVVVHFPEKHNGSAESLAFKRFCLKAPYLGQLGRMMLDAALKITVEKAAETILASQETLLGDLEKLGAAGIPDRTLYAYAVARAGLKLFEWALHKAFPGQEQVFEAKFATMYESFAISLANNGHVSMSEINRVLCDLAHLSELNEDHPHAMQYGEDYAILDDGQGQVEIDVKRAYDKYARYKRAQGSELLFDNEESFSAALLRHPQRLLTTASLLKTVRRSARTIILDYDELRAQVGTIADFRAEK